MNQQKFRFRLPCKSVQLQTAFRHACRSGQLQTAKQLYVPEVDINIAFRQACISGRLEVAKWLHSLGKISLGASKITIGATFRHTCKSGRLEVAKWIFSIWKIDIHAYQECAFRNVYKGRYHRHRQLVKWLVSLEPTCGTIKDLPQKYHPYRLRIFEQFYVPSILEYTPISENVIKCIILPYML